MFSAIQALILGAVQGVTEFFPVSSSAHLVLIPWLLRWKDPGLTFDVALHLGTLLALLLYYWRDWVGMAASPFNGDRSQRRLLGLLVIATIPGAAFGFLFEKQAATVFRSPLRIAIALAVLGVALWVFDYAMTARRKINEFRWSDAILIGLSQALAIMPGVSRSGATITMARVLGIERESAANFSFLMDTPIIAGAGLLEARKLIHIGFDGPMGVGFVTSLIFSLLAITGLIRFVRARSYAVFAWYRFAAAAFVIAIFILRA